MDENESLTQKGKLLVNASSETAKGPEGKSLLDAYEIDRGRDRMPVELLEAASKPSKDDASDEVSQEEGKGLPNSDRY